MKKQTCAMFSRCKRANRVVHSANEWNLAYEVTEEFINQLKPAELKALCRKLSRELIVSNRIAEENKTFCQWARQYREDEQKKYSDMLFMQELETKRMTNAFQKTHASLEEEREKLQKERLLLEKTSWRPFH